MILEPLSETALAKIFKTSPQDPEKLIKREDKNHEFKESYHNGTSRLLPTALGTFSHPLYAGVNVYLGGRYKRRLSFTLVDLFQKDNNMYPMTNVKSHSDINKINFIHLS